MNTNDNRINEIPPVGMAAWLLNGGRMIDRIEWIINNGFKGVSFLQNIMDIDHHEREEIAAAIVSAHLYVTYHGNVQDTLSKSGELDTDFTNRMLDDVIWWHENTNGVYSCCSDSINVPQANGNSLFDFDLNQKHITHMAGKLSSYGIHVGIENSFGGKNRLCSLDSFNRFKEMCSGHRVGMLLDAAHANIHVRSDGEANEDSIASYVSGLPFEIHEVHFSDNFGKQDEHKQLGYGNLDLVDLFTALKDKDFTGKFTIEVCRDILTGQYGSDIHDPRQTDALLISKNRIIAAYASLA